MNENIYEKVSGLIGQLQYTKRVTMDAKEANDPVERSRLMTDLEMSLENSIQDALVIEEKMEEAID